METFATEMSKFCSLKVTSLTKGLFTRGMRFIISNCIFCVFCRPENPRRRTSIELDEIKESLRNNGCWPFHPSGPILLETDESDEDNNSPIVINQAPGTSEPSSSSGSQKPNLTNENEKFAMQLPKNTKNLFLPKLTCPIFLPTTLRTRLLEGPLEEVILLKIPTSLNLNHI